MKKNITLLDGACGTCLYEKADARGLLRTPTWQYSLSAPDMVEELEKEYINAGTKIIQTNTFSANPAAVKRAGFVLDEVIEAGVRIARKSTGGTDCRVSLDIGPLSVPLDPYGDLTEEECRESFAEVIKDGRGADLITLETFLDLHMLGIAAEEAFKTGLPVIVSMTYQKGGRTLFGNSAEETADFAGDLQKKYGKQLLAVGINCSFGPKDAMDVLRVYKEKTSVPLLFKPNADEGMSAEEFAKLCVPSFELADYVGSCCGSSPAFISALAFALQEYNTL